MLPALAKLHLLAHGLDADPLLVHGGLAVELVAGWRQGLSSIDPNIGFTSQALGHRAALELLAGRLPWWNPYEGVGMPLAGEMQSAALFPLTPLLLFRDGQLWMHIILQMIAGGFSYQVLRRLGCVALAAAAGAMLFEFNGTYAWLGNAVINPIAFLPMILHGVERTRVSVAAGRPGGWAWISVGLALSLAAGFPEVAYLDGLLVGCWVLVRSRQPHGLVFVGRVALAGASGLLMAAPVLAAFLTYLPDAYVGGHTMQGFLGAYLPPDRLVNLLVPYLTGSVFGAETPAMRSFWSSVGGYAGVALAALAVAGAAGARLRPMRLLLAGWVIVTIAVSYGAPGADLIVRLVPGLGAAAFGRYLPPSWEFCLACLAALAIDDVASGSARRQLAVGVALTAAALLAGVAAGFRQDIAAASPVWYFGSLALAGGGLLALSVLIVARLRPGMRAGLAAVVVGAEALGYFLVPTIHNPRRATLETGGVSFLREHLGLQRFFTLGPIAANYGAYFGIASVNHNDLPLPRRWVRHVRESLDDNSPEILFTGFSRVLALGPTAAANLARNLAGYEDVGVRFVVAPADDRQALGPGVVEVYRDRLMAIYELPAPRPYFAAPGCRLQIRSREAVVAECERAARLVRLELFMPGWRAFVNGGEVAVEEAGPLFQQIALPAGTASVAFSFRPPAMRLAYAASGLSIGFVLLCGTSLFRGGGRVSLGRPLP